MIFFVIFLDVFLDDQLYAVFAFENAGQALEAFTVSDEHSSHFITN